MLAKQAWRLLNNPNSLWAIMLKQIYFPNVDLVRAKRRRNDSLLWHSLLHGRDMLFQLGRWLIGDGKSVNIREDVWMPGGEKAVLIRVCEVEKVHDLIDTTNICWDLNKISSCFSQSTAQKILQIPISWRNESDIFWWPHSRSGLYSVKSGYFMIRQNGVAPNLGPFTSRGIPHNIWKILWKIHVPQKLKHFLWKACNNILPVRENLVKKKVVPSGLCPLCNQEGVTSRNFH